MVYGLWFFHSGQLIICRLPEWQPIPAGSFSFPDYPQPRRAGQALYFCIPGNRQPETGNRYSPCNLQPVFLYSPVPCNL